MSHYTEQVLAITDASLLKETLKRLGYTVREDVKQVGSHYYSERYACEFAIEKTISGQKICEVGVKKNTDGTYAFVGDFYRYGFGHQSQEMITREIGLAYGEDKIRDIVNRNRNRMKVTKAAKNEAGDMEMLVEVNV